MLLPPPAGFRIERWGRVAFAVPESYEVRGSFQLRALVPRDELWPVPSEPDRRAARAAARAAERDALWRRWFAELVAEAAGIAPEDYDPATFDASSLTPGRQRQLPVLVEERQLARADLSPATPRDDARWLRLALYHRSQVFGTDSLDLRALLDAGDARLWLDGSADADLPPLIDRKIAEITETAGDYRAGAPLDAPAGAFVLRHGWVLRTDADTRNSVLVESSGARAAPEQSVVAAVIDGAPRPSPLDHVSVSAKVLNKDPEPGYDYTFDQGLAAGNAMGRAVGVSFEKVREGVVRSASGVEGYASVSLARERGDAPTLGMRWHARGARRALGEPEIEVEADATLGDLRAAWAGTPLSGRALDAAVEEALAAWDRVIDSVHIP